MENGTSRNKWWRGSHNMASVRVKHGYWCSKFVNTTHPKVNLLQWCYFLRTKLDAREANVDFAIQKKRSTFPAFICTQLKFGVIIFFVMHSQIQEVQSLDIIWNNMQAPSRHSLALPATTVPEASGRASVRRTPHRPDTCAVRQCGVPFRECGEV